MDYVLLLPGQGSQRVGMGKDLAETFPVSRAVFEAVDEAVGNAVSALAFNGPSDELTRTHNAQEFFYGRVHVQMTEWPDLGSTRRGRLTPEGLIAPFMEHIIANDGGY